MQGFGGLPKDDREAVRLLKLAADQGVDGAQADLGFFYAQGRGGLPKDEREAARLLKLAADQGHPPVQYLLASYYEGGGGGLLEEAAAVHGKRETGGTVTCFQEARAGPFSAAAVRAGSNRRALASKYDSIEPW